MLIMESRQGLMASLVDSVPKKLIITASGDVVEEAKKEVLEEDAIDKELRKVDGWIRLNEGAKERKLNDFIAVCLNQCLL